MPYVTDWCHYRERADQTRDLGYHALSSHHTWLQVTFTRHKQQASSERTIGHFDQSIQLSWNKIVTTRLELLMLVNTRITHSGQCCNYLIEDCARGVVLKLTDRRHHATSLRSVLWKSAQYFYCISIVCIVSYFSVFYCTVLYLIH